ncbi:MAG: hypothetical protein JRN67_11555 [Nitrososphaerota archaeon]|nr:hypothetical protein [Nitrososphaerota archaeon]
MAGIRGRDEINDEIKEFQKIVLEYNTSAASVSLHALQKLERFRLQNNGPPASTFMFMG